MKKQRLSLLLLLLPCISFAQNFDIGLSGGAMITTTTQKYFDTRAGIGAAFDLSATRLTKGLLYYGVSFTGNEICVRSRDYISYGAQHEVKVESGYPLCFGVEASGGISIDKESYTSCTGVSLGYLYCPGNRALSFDPGTAKKIYPPTSAIVFTTGVDIKYVRYFEKHRLGIGVNVRPRIIGLRYGLQYALVYVPVEVGLHLKL